MGFWIGLSLASCAGVLACEWGGAHRGVWVFKPLAAAAFVALALSLGALESRYGVLLLSGLCLCWLGDVLLIPRASEPAFLAGLTSFLLGHVLYAVAFLHLGVDARALAVGAAVVAAGAGIVLPWLRPHLEGVFRVAVPAYVAVIAAMLALAIGAVGAGAPPGIAVGAAAFAVSDVAVARERMVQPGFANGAWGLPLYFAAQLVLASTAAAYA